MKIFISSKNNKFIKNLILSKIEGLGIISGDHKQQLYKIHQHHKINAYIFSLDDLDDETLQFIGDYHNQIKIFIYHNVFNRTILEGLSGCYHLSDTGCTASNFIQIPTLVNTDIFKNMQLPQRAGNIVSFIDNVDSISTELSSLLYPNKSFNIKLYGGTFGNIQNLGLVSEQDKADILNRNVGFLSLDTDYIQEALICGCDIYTIESLKDQQKINSHISLDHQTYTEFLTNILI